MKKLNIRSIINEWVYNCTPVYMIHFNVLINKDMLTYFVNDKILLIIAYKESDKLQNRSISLPIAIVTVSVYNTCIVINQAWACDLHLVCHM